MNITRVLLTALLITLSFHSDATQTAHATLFCFSLRFQQGEDASGDTLDLSTLPGSRNGELAPWLIPSAPYTHRSGFVLDWSGVPISGTIYLEVPFADANGDGFDDNFEVAQAVAFTSYSEYATPSGGGTITATWNRGAGWKEGTCRLHLVDDTYGDLGFYRHTFEVLEFTGPLTYTPGSNTVNAIVNLTNAVDHLQGPAIFMKMDATNHNQLTFPAGGWTNAALQTLTYARGGVQRDWPWPTNYYGTVQFDDGDPNTGGADYRWWVLSIDDSNDADHDGIPDFSDTPAAVVRRPVLSLTRGVTDLLLTISGSAGRLHDIQAVSSVNATNWETVASLTLTNDPQTIALPLPATDTKFWRAVAH